MVRGLCLHTGWTRWSTPQWTHCPAACSSRLTAEACKVLDKLAGDLLREGIHSHSEVRQGAVAEMLVDVARQYDAGLIVIGTKGMEGAGPVVVGAIAERLVRLAPCPVLAVAADWNAGPHRPTPGGPVLLAMERNDAAAAAAATAYSLARNFRSAFAGAARADRSRSRGRDESMRRQPGGFWRSRAGQGAGALPGKGRQPGRCHCRGDSRKSPLHSCGRSETRERDAGAAWHGVCIAVCLARAGSLRSAGGVRALPWNGKLPLPCALGDR